MELKILNERQEQLDKKITDLYFEFELYKLKRDFEDLKNQAIKEGYKLDNDTGKWVKEGN